MPVPAQRELHMPILAALNSAAGGMRVKDIGASVAETLSLSESERTERTEGGTPMFRTRIRGALSTLKDDGLVLSPSRGWYKITPKGVESLPAANPKINPDDDDVTPTERMADLYEELNDALADDLLTSIRTMPPLSFERLVIDLLEAMGYGEGLRVGGSGDQGIDGVTNQDPLGLEKVCIQAKRWQDQRAVGEPEIRNFAGSLDARGASKGVFITASSFNSKAKETARDISLGSKLIRLIDGGELATLMIRHNVGVITEITYALKKPDENYFSDDV